MKKVQRAKETLLSEEFYGTAALVGLLDFFFSVWKGGEMLKAGCTMYMCCTGHASECWLGSYSNVPRWSTYSSLPPEDTLGRERKRWELSKESVSPFWVLACLRLLTTRNLFLLSFVFLYSGTSLSILTTLLFRLPLLRPRNILQRQLHHAAA